MHLSSTMHLPTTRCTVAFRRFLLLILLLLPIAAEAAVIISGRVYNDADASQSFTSGDTGLAGVTVVVYDPEDDWCESVATAGDGTYSFSVASSGTVQIYEAAGETPGALTVCAPSMDAVDPATQEVTRGTIRDPDGYMSTTANRIDLTLSGSNVTGLDFGDMTRGADIPCGSIGYLFQKNPSELWVVDLVTGDNALEVDTWTEQLNGVGYDVLSGLIWGSIRPGGSSPNRIGFVDGDWNELSLPIVNFVGTSEVFEANSGDVDLDGYLYAGTAGGSNWRKIDLNPQRTTYLHAVNWATNLPDTSPVPVKGPGTGVDMAFSPIDGIGYSVSNKQKLVSVDPDSGDTALLGDLSEEISADTSSGFGAQFMDDEGFLYISHNATGDIFRVDLSTPPTGGAVPSVTFFAHGPSSTKNDGARCSLAETADIDFGDAPASYATLLNDDGARHIVLADALYLGATAPDSADNAAVSADATGDNDRELNDEDITSAAFDNYVLGDSAYDVDIPVNNGTGANAFVRGWIDWNADGSFDGADESSDLVEVIAISTKIVIGIITMSLIKPSV